MKLKTLENENEYNNCKKYVKQLESFKDESPKFIDIQNLIDKFSVYIQECEDNNIEIQ